MKNKLLNISLILSSLFCTSQLSAESDDLMSLISNNMDHYTEVATQTKQNEHYQPYVISTFSGKDLEKLGIVNLEEALGLIPGVDMAVDNFTIKAPIFRGSNPQVYGQSKLFIDGVLANAVLFDGYSEHLKMPTEMIKRIEVVRGPGSKTDGYNAYAGSINVITYAEGIDGYGEGDSVVLKGGSYNYMMGGFVKSYELDDFRLTTDLSYQKDEKTLKSGIDGIDAGYASYIVNKGIGSEDKAHMWIEALSIGATLNYKDNFYTKFRYLEHTQGTGHGTNYHTSDHKNGKFIYPNHYLELGYNDSVGNFNVSVNAGAKYDAYNPVKVQGMPDGWTYEYTVFPNGDFNTTDTTFPDGAYYSQIIEQVSYYQSTFVTYDGIENHNIKMGYRVNHAETTDMYNWQSNFETGDVAFVDYTDVFVLVKVGSKRDTHSIFLEDSYTFSDSLSFLVGLNYEKATSTEAQYNPKASLVYQADRSNIFKLLYARSHRNPSWMETFVGGNDARQGSEGFDPEKVEAYEAAYIYKIDSSSHLQSNLFYLKNSDQLQIIADRGVIGNVGETNIYGFELEYKGHITSNDMFYFNYSYIDGNENGDDPLKNLIKYSLEKVNYEDYDFNYGNSLSSVAQHMAKAYYSYDLTSELSLSTVIKYIGEKKRSATDTRTQALKDYTKVDLTTRYDNSKYDYSLMASVKNVFDSDIRFASPQRTYDDDYYQEGRNFMITLKKEF